MDNNDLQKHKDARARLQGCELNHLTIPEAKVIQELRRQGYADADMIALILVFQNSLYGSTIRNWVNGFKG